MSTYTILPGQSLFDIAIQVYGDVDATFWLLADNSTLTGITDRLEPGQTLLIREGQMNPRQATALQDFGPFQTVFSEDDKASGIGYWRLEDIIIS